jgi:hypothetical protein
MGNLTLRCAICGLHQQPLHDSCRRCGSTLDLPENDTGMLEPEAHFLCWLCGASVHDLGNGGYICPCCGEHGDYTEEETTDA